MRTAPSRAGNDARRRPGATAAGAPRLRFQITGRGWGLAAYGIALTALGVGFATAVLVYIGLALICAALVSGAWLAVSVQSFLRAKLQVQRRVTPHPLTVGISGQVAATFNTYGGRTSVRERRAPSLDIREQVATELTGSIDTQATLKRNQGSLTLHYNLHPYIRGRWLLGPALVRLSAPFGTMYVDIPVGHVQPVPVWPATVDLSGVAGVLMGNADDVARGAPSPAADDASLRAYQDGDDLRRVHWPSSARRASMMVRMDEQAGRRPATVILHPSSEPEAFERALTAAASIAVSILGAGHPARLVGAGLDPAQVRHLGERSTDVAHFELLDQTVDLQASDSPTDASADLIRSARLVAQARHPGEVTVAIVEPLTPQELRELVPLGETGRAWAVVRGDSHSPEQVQDTVTGLQRAGWRVTTSDAGDDLEDVWRRLLAVSDVV